MELISPAECVMTSLKCSDRHNFCFCLFKVTMRRNPVGPNIIAQCLIPIRRCIIMFREEKKKKEASVRSLASLHVNLVVRINKDPEKKSELRPEEGAESEAGDDDHNKRRRVIVQQRQVVK